MTLLDIDAYTMSMQDPITFIAEVKQVTARKTASLDIEYSVKLVTDSTQALLLGELPADVAIQIKVMRS